jgi:hypothetical protein
LNTIDHVIANDRRSFFLIAISRSQAHRCFLWLPGSKAKPHDLSANQIAMTTRATTMVPHTAGVTRFVLPLRGESLAAWSNFIGGTFNTGADLPK